MHKRLRTLLFAGIALSLMNLTAVAESPPVNAPPNEALSDETPGEVYVAATIGMASEAKRVITEYFLIKGELPNSNKQAGLDTPKSFASEDSPLTSLTVLEGGVVELSYNETTGVKDGKVRFIPTPMGPKLEWRCEAADYPGLTKYVSGC
ncbi:MAG: pilin [Deltaproteobacteria bacterium]|nr:pilin [Deltaproteobacteria bacterium]